MATNIDSNFIWSILNSILIVGIGTIGWFINNTFNSSMKSIEKLIDKLEVLTTKFNDRDIAIQIIKSKVEELEKKMDAIYKISGNQTEEYEALKSKVLLLSQHVNVCKFNNYRGEQ